MLQRTKGPRSLKSKVSVEQTLVRFIFDSKVWLALAYISDHSSSEGWLSYHHAHGISGFNII